MVESSRRLARSMPRFPARRRGQRRCRRPSEGQRRPDRGRLVLEAEARRPERARRADGRRPTSASSRCSLDALSPLTDPDRGEMLAAIGVAVGRCAVRRRAAARGSPASSTCRRIRASSRSSARWAASRRRTSRPGAVPSSLGGGAYRHHVPAAVDDLIQRGEFLTSYTPYQPEIARARCRRCSSSRPRWR